MDTGTLPVSFVKLRRQLCNTAGLRASDHLVAHHSETFGVRRLATMDNGMANNTPT